MAGLDLTPRAIARKLGALAAAAAIAVGLQAHEDAGGGNDMYRYSVERSASAESCGYAYVELGTAARSLRMSPGHAKAAADDGAAVLTLEQPFELYQSAVDALVVSGNGYLAAADAFSEDDGSDFSNDCPLPEQADNPAASQERIYVYHDDLRPRHDSGQVRHAYFAKCPRASAQGRAEACTVVEWNGFERSGPLLSTQPLRAQAVLYHGSQEIALQYATLDDSRAASATIGLQGFGGRAGRMAGCNTQDVVRAERAVCFFDPRHPPQSHPVAGR